MQNSEINNVTVKRPGCDDGKRLCYSTCSVIAHSSSLSNAHKSRAHTRQTQPTLINNSHRLVCRLTHSHSPVVAAFLFFSSFFFNPPGHSRRPPLGLADWLLVWSRPDTLCLSRAVGLPPLIFQLKLNKKYKHIPVFLSNLFFSVIFHVFILAIFFLFFKLDVLFWRLSVCQSVPHNNLRRSELLFFHFGSLLSCLFLLNDWQCLFFSVQLCQILSKIEPIKSFFFKWRNFIHSIILSRRFFFPVCLHLGRLSSRAHLSSSLHRTTSSPTFLFVRASRRSRPAASVTTSASGY